MTPEKKRAWLTELGSWFRDFRVETDLWTISSVNHKWEVDETSPALQVPALFVIADPDTSPVWLFAEAKRRMDQELPGTDRVPVGISQVGKQYVVCLELTEFMDILTDSLLSRLQVLSVGIAPEGEEVGYADPEDVAATISEQLVDWLNEHTSSSAPVSDVDEDDVDVNRRIEVLEIFEEFTP